MGDAVNTTLPNYPPATALDGSELVPIWQNNGQKSATVEQVLGPGLAEINSYIVQAQAIVAATGNIAGTLYTPTSAGAAPPYKVGGIAINAVGTATSSGRFFGGSTGLPGFVWSYLASTTGGISDPQWESTLSTSNTPPELTAAAGGASGVTAVATMIALANGESFWAISADSTQIVLWQISAGVVAPVNDVTGSQVARPLSLYFQDVRGSYIRAVTDYGARASIPMAERYGGMKVFVAKAIDLGGGNYRGLWFALSFTDLSNSGWALDDAYASNWIAFVSRPIFDSGVLYFPALYVLTYESQGYGDLYEPSAGIAAYVPSPISTGNSIRRHMLDLQLAASGPLDDAIIEVDDNTYPLRDTNRYVVLATTRNGQVIDLRDYSLVGDLPGGSVPNQYAYGKLTDRAPFTYPGAQFGDSDAAHAVPVDITDTDLLALGFTRGIKGQSTYPATMGDYRSTPINVGDYIVCRFYLWADVAGDFGIPQLFIYTSESAVNTPIEAPLFRQINTRVREYYYAGRATAAGIGKWAVGSNNTTGSVNRVTVTGVQFYCGPTPAFWINRGDYPSPPDPAVLMADEVFLVSDRPLPFWAANGLADRTTAITSEASTSPAPSSPIAAQPYYDAGNNALPIWLDPAELAGDNLTVTVRADDAPHVVATRTIPARVLAVPIATAKPIKVVYFGDSHSASEFPLYLRALLTAWGITPTFYGTLENGSDYGEGRGGWSIANFFGTYQYLDPGASVPVWTSVVGAGSGQTSAYTSGGFSVHQNTNPFLNNGTSGSAAPVISGSLPLLGGGTASGFRFDLVNYRTRFGLPSDADIILWDIGDNDVGQAGASGALTRMNALYPIMLAEMRRAWPSAQILCWAGAIGLTNPAEIQWEATRPVLAAQLAAVRAAVTAGDTKLHYASTWMHHSIRNGFTLNTGAVDPLTQMTLTTVQDATHPDRFPGRAQSLEALAAAIANLVGA